MLEFFNLYLFLSGNGMRLAWISSLDFPKLKRATMQYGWLLIVYPKLLISYLSARISLLLNWQSFIFLG
jgi:hypothetical protein